MLQALERAVEIAGGQSEFARRLTIAREQLFRDDGGTGELRPIKQQHVDYWLRVMKKLPAEHARPAEMAVDGKVSRHEFRPDVFGLAPGAQEPNAAQLPLSLATGQ